MRAGACPGALPLPPPDQGSVPRRLSPRQGPQVALLAVEPVPRLPGRQPGLRMHALEQPHAQRVRLAAALLPAERGLRAEFQGADGRDGLGQLRSEEHTSELQSLMRISYAVFCLKKKNRIKPRNTN